MSGTRLLHFGVALSVLNATKTYSGTNGTVYTSVIDAADGIYPAMMNGEPNGTELDGQYRRAQYPGFISDNPSDSSGGFPAGSEPTLTMNVTGYINGVTLIFANDEGCAVTVDFINGGTVVGTKTATATERVLFVPGEGGITAVKVTFTKTNAPETFVKVARLFPGHVTELTGKEIMTCDATRECNLGGMELPAGSLSFTVNSEAPAAFRYRELILTYWNAELIGHFFVDNVKKAGPGRYSVTAVDAIGVMATTPFSGVYMNADTDIEDAAYDLVGSTFDVTVEGYHIENVRGIVTATNKRDALLNFGAGSSLWCAARPAAGAAPSLTAPITFGDVMTNIDPESGTITDLTADEIYQETNVTEQIAVDSLEVISHAFTASAYGTIQIGNNRYNDAVTSTSFTVGTTPSGLPNVKRIAEALTIITGKKDPTHTEPTDVDLIGKTTAEYLRKTKRLTLTAANVFVDLGQKLRATIEGVTYTAAVEKINYRFGASVIANTYTAVVLAEE